MLDLNSQPEPDNYPVPEYKDSSVEKLQPQDVLVRPPSPDIDYSFRGRSSPTYDRIGNFLANYSVGEQSKWSSGRV